jgi:hypothetical protein
MLRACSAATARQAGDAFGQQLVVGLAGVQQLDAAHLQRVHRVVQVGGAHGNVLDALAVVAVQVFLDLAGLLVALFVDGMRILPQGLVMALLLTPVAWPSMSK